MRGALAEKKYLLHFAHRLGYIPDKEYKSLQADSDLLGKNFWRFYKKLR
jgi:hypothetical protein